VFWKSLPPLSSEWKHHREDGDGRFFQESMATVYLTAVCYIQRDCNFNTHHHEILILYIFFGGLFSEKCSEFENILVYNNVLKLLCLTYKFCGSTSELYIEAYKCLTVHFP
jgi:hypothetical protein